MTIRRADGQKPFPVPGNPTGYYEYDRGIPAMWMSREWPVLVQGGREVPFEGSVERFINNAQVITREEFDRLVTTQQGSQGQSTSA